MDPVVVAPRQDGVLNQNHKQCDWELIKNKDDPYVQEMGRFAVMEHVHGLVGAKWSFVGVVSCESLVVPKGKLYRLLIKVDIEIVVPCHPHAIEVYEAIVLDKECERSWELMSFKRVLPCP
ncbi:hypothetical protein SDJN03_15916, partial [Cucurbita argyrosperma subsp. sororia]